MCCALRVCVVLALLTFVTVPTGCSKGEPDKAAPAASIAADDAPVGDSRPKRERGPRPYDPEREPHPVVLFRTSLGEITVELDGQRTPLTVSNFINYVTAGHYDATIFHQIDEGFIASGGGYTKDLAEKPVEVTIRNEAERGLKNARGAIAMLRQPEDIDSAICQFFFNLADNAALDHTGNEPEKYGYCAFGKVTAGLDVLDKINKATVQKSGDFEKLPTEPVVIETVRRIK